MRRNPEVSVVMSVYNGASSVAVTMNSLLSQNGVDLEFVIVNDGSIDKTPEILDNFASRDNRIRIIHQQNKGLTSALIQGCAEATGDFIARQDVGDVSLAGRLAFQLEVFRKNPAVVMTSCGTRFIGPNGETLYEICQDGEELQRNLCELNIKLIKGVSSHTSVMYNRSVFEQVGGYRHQFKVAQDLDLWMRLSEVGICWATPEILCECRLDKNSISASRRAEQVRTARLIIKCAATRRSGRSDSALISRLTTQCRQNQHLPIASKRLREAKFYYFIGSLLRERNPEQARFYFWRAIDAWFPYLRAWYRILRSRA